MQIESLSPLLTLHSDIRGYLFGFLNGRAIGHLMRTCKKLKSQLDTEEKWKEIFLKENKGYRPDCSNWKDAYARQALIKRNIELKNVKTYQVTEAPVVCFTTDLWIECKYREITIFNRAGTSTKRDVYMSRWNTLRGHHLKDNLYITCSETLGEPSYLVLQDYDRFTIWEGIDALRTVYGPGGFEIAGDYLIESNRRTDWRVTNLINDKTILEITNTFFDRAIVCADLFLGISEGAGTFFHATNLKTKELAYYCKFSFTWNHGALFYNEHFVVLLDGSSQIWTFRTKDGTKPCSLPGGLKSIHLDCQFLYATVASKENVLHCIDLELGQTAAIYELPYYEQIASVLVDGNRLLVGTQESHLLLDKDTGITISKFAHLRRDKFAIYSHILYETNDTACVLRSLATGEIIYHIVWQGHHFTVGDGRIFDKESLKVTDLRQPLSKQKGFWSKVARLLW